jgi:hypothetical protein
MGKGYDMFLPDVLSRVRYKVSGKFGQTLKVKDGASQLGAVSGVKSGQPNLRYEGRVLV